MTPKKSYKPGEKKPVKGICVSCCNAPHAHPLTEYCANCEDEQRLRLELASSHRRRDAVRGKRGPRGHHKSKVNNHKPWEQDIYMKVSHKVFHREGKRV